MARRGTPPRIKSVAFKRPTSWPFRRRGKARKKADSGAPAPTFTPAELEIIISTLTAEPERQLELLARMRRRLHWIKRFHIESRLAFDQEPAGADVSAALVAAGNALAVLNANLSDAIARDHHPILSDAAPAAGKEHVLSQLPLNLEALRLWASAMAPEHPRKSEEARGFRQLARAADRVREALLQLDEWSRWAFFVQLPRTEDYASATLKDVLKATLRIQEAIDTALAIAKPGPRKFRGLIYTVALLAELLEKHDIPFTHSPYTRSLERVGTPQTPAGRFVLEFLRIADAKLTDEAITSAIRDFIAERNSRRAA